MFFWYKNTIVLLRTGQNDKMWWEKNDNVGSVNMRWVGSTISCTLKCNFGILVRRKDKEKGNNKIIKKFIFQLLSPLKTNSEQLPTISFGPDKISTLQIHFSSFFKKNKNLCFLFVCRKARACDVRFWHFIRQKLMQLVIFMVLAFLKIDNSF